MTKKDFKKNSSWGDKNPYDPLEVAKNIGSLRGRGAKGNYHKTVITRIGFLVIGVVTVIGAVVLGYSSIFSMIAELRRDGIMLNQILDSVVGFILLLVSLGSLIIGIFTVKNALSREKPNRKL
ncbi:MAG: hypothetical protein PHP10_05115 [Candidatus Omnitrophica bacterium]|nr:hypothetical protein [Candidatus Omnitrophota bacterium]